MDVSPRTQLWGTPMSKGKRGKQTPGAGLCVPHPDPEAIGISCMGAAPRTLLPEWLTCLLSRQAEKHMTPCLHNAKPTPPPPLSAQIQKAGPSSQVIRRVQTCGCTRRAGGDVEGGPSLGGGGGRPKTPPNPATVGRRWMRAPDQLSQFPF